MKKTLMILMLSLGMIKAKAQANKSPLAVENAPSILNTSFNPYADYSDQGNRMFINNSQFYNKDNTVTNAVPLSNAQYVQPGNSNPINHQLYEDSPAPSGTIYSGYIPIRDYGNYSVGK